MYLKTLKLLWFIDDWFPFWTPLEWLTDWMEDYGLKNSLLAFNPKYLKRIVAFNTERKRG